MKLKVILVLLLFIIPSISAQDWEENVALASQDIISFFDDVPREEVQIISGNKLSLEEKLAFNIIRSETPDAQGMTIYPDTSYDNSKHLILLGSGVTNRISHNISKNMIFLNSSMYPPVRFTFGVLGNKQILIINALKEEKNAQFSGSEKSPLNPYIPEKYIPIAVGTSSVLLLYIWQIIGKTVSDLINEFISSHILERKKHKIKKNELINYKEGIAIALSIVIFSITLSWSWIENTQDFFTMVKINLIIIGIITIIRESIRLIGCYKLKLKSEIVFWPFGTVLTFVSTLFGSTFALVAYTKLQEDEKDHKRFGKLSFAISFMTLLLAFISYITNYMIPSLYVQMTFVFSILIVFIELFPFAPLPGNDIKKWSTFSWLFIFLLCFTSYIFMNFTLFV